MIKIKRQELEELHQAITRCENLQGEKFSYALLKNQKKLVPEIRNIYQYADKVRPKQTDKLSEYISKLEDIKHVKVRDANEGPPITLEQLDEMYPEEKILTEEFDKKMRKYLDAEVDINFYLIKQEQIPQQITLAQRRGIDVLLEDNE